MICLGYKIDEYSIQKMFPNEVIAVPDSSIHFTCGNCGRRLKSPLRHAGRDAHCTCGAKCAIPIGLGVTQELPVRVADIKNIWARIYGQREDRFSPLLVVLIGVAMVLAFAGLLLAIRQTS